MEEIYKRILNAKETNKRVRVKAGEICGYSSLNSLADYSFDVLKLDLVFPRNYDKNPKTRKLMEYIINGARGMGLTPLAEGVETEEHYEFLKKVGCVRAQGYFFGKPMPLDETRNYTKGKGMVWEASNY